MKKLLSAILPLLLAIMSLTTCGDPQSGQMLQVEDYFTQPQYEWGNHSGETLVVWAQEPELERSYIVHAFQRYESLTGNHLELRQFPKDVFANQTAAAFAGEGEIPPDVLLSYGGSNIDKYKPDENFYDFTGAVWVDDLTDTSINQTIYHGKVIGLPHWEASISGTLYNKKIFKKYGLDVPQTQEEFMSVCETLKENGILPVYMPCAEASMLLYQFPLDTLIEDSNTLNAFNNGEIGYADLPEMLQVAEWYRTMAQKGYLGVDYEKNTWEEMSPALASEKYAMMLCWDTWLYTDYEGDPSDFGLMPAFIGVPENGTFEGPNLGLFIVNRHSEKLDAALEFISFLADPYNYNAVFGGIYTAPVFKNQIASISTPQYIESERLIERNYRDSIAWLRIRGFSQMDATCLLEFMQDPTGSAKQYLKQMDNMRMERVIN